MPKIPHGSGLDGRAEGTEYLREKGFGHWEVREGVTHHGGMVAVRPEEIADWDRQDHGWAAGFPIGGAPPSGFDCSIGQWDFSQACESGHLLTAGM